MDAQSLQAGLTTQSLCGMAGCVERQGEVRLQASSCAMKALSECSIMTTSSFLKHQNPETNDAFYATGHGYRRTAYPVRSRTKFPAGACSAEAATSTTKVGNHGGSWKHQNPRRSSRIWQMNCCLNSDSNSVLLSVRSHGFVWCIWLNEAIQMNQINLISGM